MNDKPDAVSSNGKQRKDTANNERNSNMHINILTGKDFTGLIQRLHEYPSVLIVYDRNVEAFAQELNCPSFAIEATEGNKNIETVIEICRFLLAHHADRNSLLLAIGGGVTTDLAGFAACIYKRGIRYANVPTTLLAQVDAGIGGKTGCNLDSFKNMLGVIRQPEFTYLSSYTLDSLPISEFRSGIAEMLKTFIIASAEDYGKALAFFSEVFSNMHEHDTNESLPQSNYCASNVSSSSGAAGFHTQFEELIEKAARIKAGIVEQDPDEKGLRRVLNLGHTYGHAIEWWQQQSTDRNFRYTHGEAVAIGIVQIARISESRGIAAAGLAERIRTDFLACGLPVELPCPESQLAEAIAQDKKSDRGKVHWVLIQDIGKVIVE